MKRATKRWTVIILVIFLLLTACQPTPEEDIVVNRGDGALEAAIAATAVPSEQPLLPVDEVGQRVEHWTDELTIRGLTCTIDADIVLPDKKVFPVYRVQQRALDAETAAQVLDYFLADATGACETTDTREEVLLDLMAARKGHFVNYPDSMDGTWQPYDGQEEDIARLERALQTVGDDEPFGPVPDTVPLDTPYTYALPDGKRFRIHVSERELTARAYFPRGFEQAESMVMDGEAYPGEPAGTTLQNVKISQEEAEAAAEAFLEHAGLAYLGLAEAEKARILQSTTYETLSEGWQLTYARSDGGCIPVYYFNQQSGYLYQRSEDYAPRWYPEALRLYVDENGIQCVNWRFPLEIVETMNENVLLLEFDEIKEQITKAIELGYAYMSEKMGGSRQHEVTVNRIVLTNVLVPMRDTVDYQMLVPAWLVFYQQQMGAAEPLTAFIAVNAVDGSTIDLKVRFGG